jgi:hypothetical protein
VTGETIPPSFLTSVLREVSFVGKFSAFFAILLLMAGMVWPTPERLYLGLALLCFTLSNHYWRHRRRPIAFTVRQGPPPWYRVVHFGRAALAVLFLLWSMLLARLWYALPSVRAFLDTALGL